MRRTPTLVGMPDFHDSVEYLRRHHRLSREAAAQQAGFSVSHFNQFIRHRRSPGAKTFDGLVRAFDLNPAQKRHLHELQQPSPVLAPAAELRRRLTQLGVATHLNHLDNREVMGAYFDPLQTVLHGNQVFHDLMPGLADADNNVVLWMLSPTARDRIDDWHSELLYTVTILRGALGRYRELPRAQSLFKTLRTHIEFRSAWDATPMQITYTRSRPTPFRLRVPGTKTPLSLSVEIDEYGACSGIFIAHGLYNPTAITAENTDPRHDSTHDIEGIRGPVTEPPGDCE